MVGIDKNRSKYAKFCVDKLLRSKHEFIERNTATMAFTLGQVIKVTKALAYIDLLQPLLILLGDALFSMNFYQ